MNIEKWLQTSIKQLKDSDVSTPKLDTELLLADLLQKDRSWLHAHPDQVLQRSDLRKLNEQIERRMKHEPIAYILGKKEFYGREFTVTADTLQPRPETENVIDVLKEINPATIIDIGTGTGCIAISAKLELPKSVVIATDISDECLEITRQNAARLNADITVLKSDLLRDISVRDMAKSTLCCNLPYVPDEYEINQSAKFEPELALFGGEDGLDYYRQLIEQVVSIPEKLRPKTIICESLEAQHTSLANIIEVADYELTDTRGLIQVFEILR